MVDASAATPHETLIKLADAFGIATEFWDWQGRHTVVSDESLIAVLKALDVDASTPEAADEAIVSIEDRRWSRMVPTVLVAELGQRLQFDVHVDEGADLSVHLRLEDGGVRYVTQVENWNPPRQVGERLIGEASFQLPDDLPLGYHRIVASSQGREAEGTLIVSPQWLGFPQKMGDRRIWGYAAQFYSVRSKRSWGIGDFVDLADLSIFAKTQHDADYVLINPVHAAQPIAPLESSPYLPSSRRYLNPLYIRVEAIPEYAGLSEKKRHKIAKLHDELAAQVADGELLDRDAAWTAKIRALRIVFAAGMSPAREMAFEAFRRTEGRELRNFATWCALAVEKGADWHQWEPEYQRASSPEVAQFAREHEKMITFYCWLQWIVDGQWAQAQLAATDAGMRIGIMNDLAVGISGSGADAWSLTDVFAKGVHVGAPADAFNQNGQDWGQPPWRPDRLADMAYAPFRQMIAGALRHAGGLRIDHVMGLFRLWWVPEGHKPSDGTYVRYDHEAMVGILALEAYRAGALVVGEDLGTVEPWVRDYLRRRGILGTSILWFENDESGHPLPADQWREYCMATVTTHDLPPTLGFLALDHVRLRSDLGLLTVSLDEEMAQARNEQRAWIDRLRHDGLLADDANDAEEIMLALYRYLAMTPARVLGVALVDAVGDRRTQNQPGTSDEYPNWRIPLCDEDGKPVLLEDVFRSDRPMRIAAIMNGWERASAPEDSEDATA